MKKLTMAQRRQLLVEALESGKYKQTTGSLADDKGYCCLGVACEVYQEHVGNLLIVNYSYNNEYMVLPKKVRKWYGFTTRLGTYATSKSGDNALSRDNDDGKSFTEIAAIIKSKPQGLFIS